MRQFYGGPGKCVRKPAGKTHPGSTKFLLLKGGGIYPSFGAGVLGSADFIFMGARIFLILSDFNYLGVLGLLWGQQGTKHFRNSLPGSMCWSC